MPNQCAQTMKMVKILCLTPCKLQIGRGAATACAISHGSVWTTVGSAAQGGECWQHCSAVKVAPSWSPLLGEQQENMISYWGG